VGSAAASAPETETTFIRQSGWLVVATVSSGVFMTATQVVANRWMEPVEYGIWFALLRIFLLMSIPSLGLQIVFAQQAAAAVSEAQHRQLVGTIAVAFRGMFYIWLIVAGVTLFTQAHWIATFKITNAVALWVTVMIGLAALWSPILRGVLQGLQNFRGLGWVLILDGVGRFAAILVILWLGGQAAGGMTGALIGVGFSVAVGAWLLRPLLRQPGAPIDWRPWLRRVAPLTLGIGSVQFMANADVVYVQAVFAADKTPLYMPAAMIGLALVTFTTPLAAVMFPKVVRSAALTQDTRALRHALRATVLLGGLAAVACTVLPKLPLQIIFFSRPTYWEAAPLVPWFTWSLLPLVLANVLLSNLLARERYAIVPLALLVALGYGVTLSLLRPRLLQMEEMDAFRSVIQTLGAFSLLLLGVSALLTRRQKVRAVAAAP
jgi:O-antigen/teichoic acid export membrane protein